jgi:hypothetical protein
MVIGANDQLVGPNQQATADHSDYFNAWRDFVLTPSISNVERKQRAHF